MTRNRQTRSAARMRILGIGAALTVAFATASCNVEGGAGNDSKDDFPSHAVELTVPFAAGGGSDLIGRLLAERIEKPLGQSVVVVNKPGSSGNAGTSEVGRSDAKGYKLVIPNATQFSITPLMVSDSESVRLDGLTIIQGLTQENNVLFTSTKAPYKTVEDVLALADSGKRVTYGHVGPSSPTRLEQMLLFAHAGINAEDVPFGGTGEVIPAVIGGHVDFGAAGLTELEPYVNSNDVRILGIFGDERSQFAPNVPTFKEKGIDAVVPLTRFIAGPKDLPKSELDTLTDAIAEVTESKEWTDLLAKNKIETYNVDGDKVRADIERDATSFEAALKDLNLQPAG